MVEIARLASELFISFFFFEVSKNTNSKRAEADILLKISCQQILFIFICSSQSVFFKKGFSNLHTGHLRSITT